MLLSIPANIEISHRKTGARIIPMNIFFDHSGTSIWRITGHNEGEDPLVDGWYDIEGEALKLIEIKIISHDNKSK